MTWDRPPADEEQRDAKWLDVLAGRASGTDDARFEGARALRAHLERVSKPDAEDHASAERAWRAFTAELAPDRDPSVHELVAPVVSVTSPHRGRRRHWHGFLAAAAVGGLAVGLATQLSHDEPAPEPTGVQRGPASADLEPGWVRKGSSRSLDEPAASPPVLRYAVVGPAALSDAARLRELLRDLGVTATVDAGTPSRVVLRFEVPDPLPRPLQHELGRLRIDARPRDAVQVEFSVRS
jgi:hypothetical protein